MPLYLCGDSALEMWRYIRTLDVLDPQPRNVCRKCAITDPIHTKHQLSGLSNQADRLLEAIPRPYHVLVKNHEHRRSSHTLQPHVWSRPLPRGTFVDLGDDIYLSSGPFLFLQLATELDFAQLIRTGLELCGIYTLFPYCSVALDPTDADVNMRKSFTGVAPVTSPAKIERFLEGCAGQPGHRTAQRALQYLLEDSGSPMETATYMFACLPKRYGGYGIPQPIFNPKVTVTTKDGPKQRRPDLYWERRSVDVEYNSDLIHLAKERYYADARRQVELTVANVNVLTLTREDAMSEQLFDRFVFLLAKKLGVRQQAFPEGWEQRRRELRRAVFKDLW